MIDRAMLFAEILKRNDIRRKAQLPLLDVQAELAQATSLACEQAYFEAATRFEDERQRILAEVEADFKRRLGSTSLSSLTRMGVGSVVNQRFHAWLEREHGIVFPGYASRNAVIYGPARDP